MLGMDALSCRILGHARDGAAMSDRIENQVDNIFRKWDKTNSPGCALIIVKDEEIVYERGYGMANLEHGVPISPDSVFDIGSTSKQFTSACVLMLSRRNKLHLDDDIRKFIYEMPDYGMAISIRHLVHHTSGLRDYLELMPMAGMPYSNDYQEEEIVGLIARQRELNFKPGDEHLYCNSGYFLLSEIVQRVSGRSLREFADENIFRPLGMIKTHFHDDATRMVCDRASAYAPTPDGGFAIDMGVFDVVGDGGLYTTARELVQWNRNFVRNVLDGGGQEFIGQLICPGALNDGTTLKYAFGLVVDSHRGLRTISHGGSWYGYRAQFLRFADQGYSFICLGNVATMNPDWLVKKAADLYLKDRFTERTPHESDAGTQVVVPSPGGWLDGIAGSYCAQEGELGCVAIRNIEGEISVEALGDLQEMTFLEPNRIISADGSRDFDLTIDAAPNGAIQTIKANLYGGMIVEVLKPIKVDSWKTENLQAFCGEFCNDEVRATHHVSAQEGSLWLKIMSLHPVQLTLLANDLLDAGHFQLRYQRDETGRIAGYSLHAGRARRMVFRKQHIRDAKRVPKG